MYLKLYISYFFIYINETPEEFKFLIYFIAKYYWSRKVTEKKEKKRL